VNSLGVSSWRNAHMQRVVAGLPSLGRLGMPREHIRGNGRAIDPLVEEPLHVRLQVPLDDAPELPDRRPAAAILTIEVPHRGDKGVFLHRAEVEHEVPEHVKHPGTFVISREPRVPNVQLLGSPPDADGRCVVASPREAPGASA